MKNIQCLFWFTVGSFLFSPAMAQVSSKPGAANSRNLRSSDSLLPLDTHVKVGHLSNGFTYYIRHNAEPKNRAELYLVNKVGSVLENDDQQGLAHFMEHMSFNGTKHYPKNELVSYLQKSGVRFGADLNAYTSFDETVYQLPIPTDDTALFKNGMQILRDWAQDATLDSAEIDKERGVVLEEKRLGKGAQQRMLEKYLPIIFNGSRYASRLPIGKEEVLKGFSYQTIRQFYKDWYRPDLQALIVVGDINPDQVEQLIISEFSDLKNPEQERPRTKYDIPLSNKNQFIELTDKEFPVTVAEVLVKHPGRVVKTEHDMRLEMIRSLYNEMLGERIGDLKKRPDPPFLQGGSSIGGFLAGLDAATSYVVAKPGEIEKGLKAVLTETERVKRFGFSATELARAKTNRLSEMESSFKEKDKTASIQFVREYQQLFLHGEASPGIEYEYQFYKDHMAGITLMEVNALAPKYLVDGNRDIIIMAPAKDSATLPSEVVVNTWTKDVKQSKILPYVDQTSSKPLLGTHLTGGKIVSEKKLPEIGVTELVLSNGAKVILKPTDFKNDEISIRGFAPGGTSLYSDSDYQSAVNAATIINQSGIGAFNAIELPKMLAGKNLQLNAYITERSQGISGTSTPKDLETALQLLYLYFTAPRRDESLFTGYITGLQGSLSGRSNDPKAVFQDSVAAVLGNYSVRRTGPSREKIQQIHLDRSFNIYKDLFSDASAFTFTFVGSFNLAQIRPMLEKYIGSLPATHQQKPPVDLGIHIPAGTIDKAIYKGQDPKSSVILMFSGPYEYNRENNNELDALAEVLTIRLLERLREDESGVYGVGANASYVKYPQGRYSFRIAFGCGPENVEKLISSALDEVKKLKTSGPEEIGVQKFKAEELRTTETQLKQNGFWTIYLHSQYENGEDPAAVNSYVQSLNNISVSTIKEAANKYLDGSNFIRIVLYPEKK